VILVDTSVWVDHFRVADQRLAEMLRDGQVLCHALVIGELACGNLQRRTEILALLKELPRLAALADDDVMQFIDVHRLMGKRLGWIDVHLLGAAFVSRASLWTKDRRLAEAAKRVGVGR
jgi:predicted nucleic acid-binding protein